MTLRGVDLRECRMRGVQNLDSLRLEACLFPEPRHHWWQTRRRMIYEEVLWRDRQNGNCSDASSADLPLAVADTLRPEEIAALYRALRKGIEDKKDVPGATDFYYGEMEMRRHSSTGPSQADGTATPRAERALLTGYWLLSGYGMRAWRALAALAALVAIATPLVAFYGLLGEASVTARLGEALQVAVNRALLRGQNENLTYTGLWITTGLRIAGPLLLGLAALAIRGRIRR